MELTPNIPFLTGEAARSKDTALEIAHQLRKPLANRRPGLDGLNRYYVGEHTAKFDTDAVRSEFARQVADLVVNWPKLMINAPAQRIGVKAFSFPTDADNDGNGADDEAWLAWLFNKMPARQSMVSRYSAVFGEVSIMVHPLRDGEKHNRWTIEDPRQVIVARDPETGEVSAALKEWSTEGDVSTRQTYSTLYLPGTIWRFQRVSNAGASLMVPNGSGGFKEAVIGDLTDRANGQLVMEEFGQDVVPVVPIYNDETLCGTGTSDLIAVIPIVDAIDKLLRDMIVASDFHALPQKWIAGVVTPTDQKTGAKIPIEKALRATNRILNLGGPDARIGQLDASDGAWHINGIELLQRMAAAISQTPQHYVDLGGNPPGADSIEAAEASLLALVEGKQAVQAVGYLDAKRVGHRLNGDVKRASDVGGAVLWRHPQRRTLSEKADAFVKLRAGSSAGGAAGTGSVGLSLETAMEIALDASPEEIAREKRLLNLPDTRKARPTADVPSVATGAPAPVPAPPTAPAGQTPPKEG